MGATGAPSYGAMEAWGSMSEPVRPTPLVLDHLTEITFAQRTGQMIAGSVCPELHERSISGVREGSGTCDANEENIVDTRLREVLLEHIRDSTSSSACST